MTDDPEDLAAWLSGFHSVALAAFVHQAIEQQGPPDVEATRRKAFKWYEEGKREDE